MEKRRMFKSGLKKKRSCAANIGVAMKYQKPLQGCGVSLSGTFYLSVFIHFLSVFICGYFVLRFLRGTFLTTTNTKIYTTDTKMIH